MTPDSILPGPSTLADLRAKKEMAFCEEYVRTGDALTAAIKAQLQSPNYPIDVVARQLLDRPDIRLVIGVLEKHNKGATPVEITRDSILADMQNCYEGAYLAGRYDTAIAAKRLQAALMGFLVEKREVTLVKSVGDMTNAELRALAYKGRVIEGSVEGGTGDATQLRDTGASGQ